MQSDRISRETREARRALGNLRSFAHRQGLTGWVDRDASWQYQRAYRAIVVLEDLQGVEATAPFADRLMALRHEAMRKHLLDAGQIIAAENAALVLLAAKSRGEG